MDYEEQKYDPKLVLRIIKTLMYCRVRKMGLTLVGIGRLLVGMKQSARNTEQEEKTEDSGLSEVFRTLEWLKAKRIVREKEGVWEWAGSLDDYNAACGKICARKIKIAKKAARYLRHIPFIRMVGICGTVATGNAKENSDIDFFVITKRDRIWSARIFVMAVLEVMGIRKKPHAFTDRICLNHFVADEEKSLEVKFKDLYSALEFARMIILINKDGTHERFIRANSWMKEYLPELDWWEEGQAAESSAPITGLSTEGSRMQEAGEKLLSGKTGDRLEQMLGVKQAGRIERKHVWEDNGEVYWGSDALVFRPKPKGTSFAAEYKAMLEGHREEIRKLLAYI